MRAHLYSPLQRALKHLIAWPTATALQVCAAAKCSKPTAYKAIKQFKAGKKSSLVDGHNRATGIVMETPKDEVALFQKDVLAILDIGLERARNAVKFVEAIQSKERTSGD